MPDWTDYDTLLELYTRVGNGDIQALEEAISGGFDPHVHLLGGDSSIVSVARRDERLLAAVYQLVGTVDVREGSGCSPLMVAVMCNDEIGVQNLLRLGASTEWRRQADGSNVLHVALVKPASEQIGRLLAGFASLAALMAENGFGDTPISQAVRWCKRKGRKLSTYLELYSERYVSAGGRLDVRMGAPPRTLEEHLRAGGFEWLWNRLANKIDQTASRRTEATKPRWRSLLSAAKQRCKTWQRRAVGR